MASSTSPSSKPSIPSIIIPIPPEPTASQAQLQAFLMALVHSYGLTNVLEALNDGMLSHFDAALEENEVSTPILEALGTAHTVAKLILDDQ